MIALEEGSVWAHFNFSPYLFMRIFYELSILCDVYKLVELFWGMIRDFIQVIEDLNFDLKFKLLI